MPKIVSGAIITADIVNSTSLSAKQGKNLIDTLSSILKPYVYEFYRGDSFQVYIKYPGDALKVVLQLRLAARKAPFKSQASRCDVRVSIGIANVSIPIKNLKTTNGDAFIISGRAFDEMDMDTRLVVESSDNKINPGLKVIAYFIDYIFKRLTTKQAMVVFELLSGKTQIDIAKKLRKTQPTINKQVQSSGWNEITRVLQEYEHSIKEL